MQKILTIIVTYNAIKWAEKCFTSLYKSTIPLDIFVIDNGSTDGTQEYITTNNPNIIFHQSPTNLGFGKANNIGIKYAIDNNYDYVYLLNQDAWILHDTIEKLIKIHEKYPQYGILSPIQVQANMKDLDSNFSSYMCNYEKDTSFFNDLYFNQRKDIYTVPDIMAAHWLISRECLLNVGGFSPTFPHYGEDNNYANRTLFHGFDIGIVPSAIAIHDRSNRKRTLEKEAYMTYIYALIIISNIYKPIPNQILHIIKYFLRFILKNKTIQPLKYCYKIINNRNKIKENTRISKTKGAFLNL